MALLVDHAAFVVAGAPPFDVRADTSVLVVDGHIAAVGDADDLGPIPPGTEVLDARGTVVVPGFVNGHGHATFGLDGGLGPESSLDEWLPTVFAVGAALGPDECRASARHTFAEMVRAGYTTCVDHHYAQAHPDNAVAVADAAIDVGLRVTLASTAYDLGEGGLDLDAGRAELARLLERCRATDAALVDPWVGLSSPLRRESPERCRALVGWAREHGCGLTYHYAETTGWFDLARDAGVDHLTDVLADLDLLGPRVVIAHGVWFDEHDHEVLAATGTTVSHNPVSNGFLGDGIAPVARMRAAGVNVCLGADSRNCTGRLDPFAAMRTAAVLARASAADGTLLPARDLLAMATTAGAAAVGRGPGTIEVGAAADLVLVDLEAPHLQPVHDPIWSLVWSAGPGDVRDVVVAGEVVVGGGELRTVDELAVTVEARDAARTIAGAVERHGPSTLPYARTP